MIERTAGSAALGDAERLDRSGRHREAIAVLSRAAMAGDLVAKRTVGLRILLGDRAPLLGQEGARLITEAAAQGDVASADLAAVIAGAGVHGPQDWSRALDWLQLAAELGSPRARQALRLLCPDAPLGRQAAVDAPAADLWRRMRATVSVTDLLTAPPCTALHDDPLIRVHPGFAEPRLCEWMIAQARDRLRRARVYNPSTRTLEHTPERTNSSANFTLRNLDLAQIVLQARIAAAIGAPFSHLESPFVLHYAPGQAFEDHYDFVDPATPDYEQEILRSGQRMVTFLIYLNDGYTGGRTEFPRLGVSHEGQAGEGFSFVNALPDGAADTRTLHAGRPPHAGEKWVLTQFIRNRAVVPGAVTAAG